MVPPLRACLFVASCAAAVAASAAAVVPLARLPLPPAGATLCVDDPAMMSRAHHPTVVHLHDFCMDAVRGSCFMSMDREAAAGPRDAAQLCCACGGGRAAAMTTDVEGRVDVHLDDVMFDTISAPRGTLRAGFNEVETSAPLSQEVVLVGRDCVVSWREVYTGAGCSRATAGVRVAAGHGVWQWTVRACGATLPRVKHFRDVNYIAFLFDAEAGSREDVGFVLDWTCGEI